MMKIKPLHVQMTQIHSQNQITLSNPQAPVTISLGGYTEKMRFAANPLNYDLLLRKKWTSAHKEIISC